MNKRSQRWFRQHSYQQTYGRVAEIPSIVIHGPNIQNKGEQRPNTPDGQKRFVVGQTKIGGEEVVG
jgi:hypothetical protein